ncbi:MAG: SDR family NAD(P)-dependent oxidoreductase [Bacteroidetes bacterium]|jgi:NAD(P)-dependent dehydrogenase (short-subunit alcohol dehydrogenase family)|nr:SDR family NAD(P)-dependent oxidoreductase [Bacteroidota bacterium]
MSNRPVIITGVSSGIGKETAIYLLDKGIPVYGSVRCKEDGEDLKQAYPSLFKPLIFDVRDAKAIKVAAEKVSEEVKPYGLAGLVNNAGIAVSGPLQHVKSEYMQKQMDVNVHGLLRVSQAFLPLLGANKQAPTQPGRMVNISSVSGRMTRMMMGPYSASKYAVEAISDGFRRELKMYGIQVAIVEPGPITTEIWKKARTEDQPYMDTDYTFILNQRSQVIDQNEDMAISAKKVAEKIYHALYAKRPKTRYLVTGKKWLIRLVINYLPTRIVDHLFTQPFLKKANKPR